MSDSGRHILAKEVDQLVRNFENLRPYKWNSLAKFLQAKRDLDGMIEKLHVQIKEDRKIARRLRLRHPRLQVAMTRAMANNDLRSRHDMDGEFMEIPIRRNEIVAELRSMVEDEKKIFNLVIEL
ncbi:uncharacterized protein EAE98_004308 [Botrytis deweyae]|uniref:Uncharacterized protein n=1 Tax=Botrytis deweyae TaxID=2478750 RepID=A0ABQ7IQJ6_9HELO|nr:uncharacterized protein EAE98_004308 [Botrytis deweyae]KAF7931572.1 hypothetical protein EAE98_004308 [Botrytis deweyae]